MHIGFTPRVATSHLAVTLHGGEMDVFIRTGVCVCVCVTSEAALLRLGIDCLRMLGE